MNIKMGNGSSILMSDKGDSVKSIFQDDKDVIAKQAEQIKVLRDKLTMANEWLSVECGYIGSPVHAEISKALEKTKEKA